VEVIVLPSPELVCERAARVVARLLRGNPAAVLALPTGNTPRAVYAELARLHRAEGLSFARASAFGLDEYLGIAPDHPGAFRRYLNETLYRHVDLPPERAYAPDGLAQDPLKACQRYEVQIAAAGGLDLALLGLGRNGHIAFNEPTSSFASRTRLETLADETRAANQAAFGSDPVPRYALTVGIATILGARRCLLLAFGASKSGAVARLVEGPLTARVPASALQLHPHATVLVDEAAAAGLELRGYYDAVAAAKPASQRDD
jgi:glucosamine-6-phosphate deaminase